MEVVVLAFQEDVITDLGFVRHAPDLGAELSAVSFEEGPLLTRLDCLFLREPDRIEIREGEAVGTVGEMPLRERRNPLFLRILTGLGEPDAEVNTAFWSGKKTCGAFVRS